MKSFFKGVRKHIGKLDAEHLREQYALVADEFARSEMLFHALKEGLVRLDADGAVLQANPAAKRLLGMAPEDMLPTLGLPLGRATKREIAVTYPEARALEVQTIPLGDETIVYIRDITAEKRRTEEDLRAGATQAVRDLASGVAHEIGNPLNAIGLNLQLLRREMKNIPDEERRADLSELVDSAYGEVSRLDLILKKFLRALRPSAPALAPCDVLHELEESLKVMKADIEAHRVSVTVDHPESLPKIQGDGEQLRQVFFNLVKNSVQAMADGGTLAIALSADDRDLTVAFRDSGEGIPKEDFQQLFQPFHTTKPHGHGIGLAIVQRIVQDHGGRIDVSSKPGEGTCFRLVFPLADCRVRRLAAPQ